MALLYPNLFKPIKIGNFTSPNRVALAPTDISSGNADGSVNDIPINTEDYATVMFRFKGGTRGVMTVNQVAAGRKNRLSFELNGSKKGVFWESELPNQMWIGKRDGNNEILIRDPSLVHEEVQGLIDFPGGHNEGFPDTSKQMFKEVYRAVAAGKIPEKYDFPISGQG